MNVFVQLDQIQYLLRGLQVQNLSNASLECCLSYKKMINIVHGKGRVVESICGSPFAPKLGHADQGVNQVFLT